MLKIKGFKKKKGWKLWNYSYEFIENFLRFFYTKFTKK